MTAVATGSDSPRRLGRPPRDEADGLTAHIVACASKLFLRLGYAGTSIEAVATEAKVGKNTIYRRYATKADLFQAVADDQMRTLLPPLESIRAEEDWRGALRQVAILLITASVKADTVALERLVIAEAIRFPEIATIYIDRGNARATEIVRDMLAWSRSQIRKDGPGPPEEILLAAEQFISCMVYVPHTFALMGRRKLDSAEEIEAYVDRALPLFLDGWIGSLAGR